MEESFCLRELVEKRFQSQRSSTILTPLERFLSSTSNIFKPACHASEGEVPSKLYAGGAVSLFNTIGAVPSGILLNKSSMYEGLVCFGGKSLAALSIDKMHANTSFSSPSSSSNSTTVPGANNIIKGQWTAEEDRFYYDTSEFTIFYCEI
jgi:hypothetical protein